MGKKKEIQEIMNPNLINMFLYVKGKMVNYYPGRGGRGRDKFM